MMTTTYATTIEMLANRKPASLVQGEVQQVEAMKHPRIFLLGADYLNSNLGIRALTSGAITAIIDQHPNASVEILEYGTESRQLIFDLPKGRVTVPMINIRFSKRIWSKNHIVRLIITSLLLRMLPSSWRMKLLSRNPLLSGITDTDSVLALSGGDSFSDIYGLRRLVYMSLPQILTLLLDKSLIQLPQTIGPFKRRISRIVARSILSRSSLIYSRDEEAVPQIRSLLPVHSRERVRFCPDLGFMVPAKVPARMEAHLKAIFSQRPVAGVNVSGLLYMGGYSRKNMFGLTSSYKEVVKKSIEFFIQEKDVTVLLVPHVAALVGEGDTLVCLEILRKLQPKYPERIFALTETYDESEIKYVIAQCDFFVGARMHSCIAALSQRVPTAAMAYSDKFAGVLRSAGMLDAVLDLRALSAEQATARLALLYDTRAVLKARLQVTIPQIEKQILNLLNVAPKYAYSSLANASKTPS